MSARELHERDLQRTITEARESAAKKLRAGKKRTNQTFDKEGRVVRKRVGGASPPFPDVKNPRGIRKRVF